MTNSANPVLQVATSAIDTTCKAILNKLLQNGWSKAGVPYVVEQSVLSESELSYLLTHGAISVQGGDAFAYRPVLQNYSVPKDGPERGMIGFRLNFDLA